MELAISLVKKTLLGAALGLLAALLVLFVTRVFRSDLFARIEAETLDSRYLAKIAYAGAQRRNAPIEDIVIVDVDQRSLEKLGSYAQWPRSHHAAVIDYLHADGAAVIAFDILFMDRGADPYLDQVLLESVQRAGNVVNALAFSRSNPEIFLPSMSSPPPEFQAQRYTFHFPARLSARFPALDYFPGKLFQLYNQSAGLGFVNFPADNDDTIRRFPLLLNFGGQTYPSLALAVVMQRQQVATTEVRLTPQYEAQLGRAANGTPALFIPMDERSLVPVNYQGGFQTFRYVSYYDVFEKRVAAGFFRDKIVLIGTSVPGLYDLRVVPFQNDFPGVEIHANLIYSILRQDFLWELPQTSALIILLVVAILIGVVAVLLSPWASILLTLVGGAGYSALTFWSFTQRNLLMTLVEPLLGMALALLIGMIYRYRSEERQKNFFYGMFGSYLSDNLVQEMLRNPAKLRLGGERKYATTFFSDLKDFTSISERLSPEEMLQQLNEYLSAMTDIVLKYGGYLDKYDGDAIMAAYGVPIEEEDHAERACFAALEMQEKLRELRRNWQAENRPLLQARIGINSGNMIAGNIGGKHRFDYTVIGDSVNLAARLEGVNKMYGTSIIVSEETHELAKEKIIVRELDYIRVKGKTKPVRVFELLARRDRGIDHQYAAVFSHFARGLEHYRLQNWKRAIFEFRRVLQLKQDDGPATEFLRRCEVFMQSPRPATWDGVFEMRGK